MAKKSTPCQCPACADHMRSLSETWEAFRSAHPHADALKQYMGKLMVEDDALARMPDGSLKMKKAYDLALSKVTTGQVVKH